MQAPILFCVNMLCMAMKKFHIELTGFIEMDTDQERDARMLTGASLKRSFVFSEHGAILVATSILARLRKSHSPKVR